MPWETPLLPKRPRAPALLNFCAPTFAIAGRTDLKVGRYKLRRAPAAKASSQRRRRKPSLESLDDRGSSVRLSVASEPNACSFAGLLQHRRGEIRGVALWLAGSVFLSQRAFVLQNDSGGTLCGGSPRLRIWHFM